jgi:hypothetical protein
MLQSMINDLFTSMDNIYLRLLRLKFCIDLLVLLIVKDKGIVKLIYICHWLHLEVWCSWTFFYRCDELLFKLLNFIYHFECLIILIAIEVLIFLLLFLN